MEPPLKRRRTVGHDNPAEIYERRARIDLRLKSTFESIFEKYGKDFSGIGDEIDLKTGEIVVNHGHVFGMRDEIDPGRPEDLYDELNSDEESSTPIRRLKRKGTIPHIHVQAVFTRRVAAEDVDDLGIDFPDTIRKNLPRRPGRGPMEAMDKGDTKLFYKSRHSYPPVATAQQQQTLDPLEERQATESKWQAPPLPKKIRAMREAVSVSPFLQPKKTDERSPSPPTSSIWACASSAVYLETPNELISEKFVSIVSRGKAPKAAIKKPEDHVRVQPVKHQSPQANIDCPHKTCGNNRFQTATRFYCKSCMLKMKNGSDRPVSPRGSLRGKLTRHSDGNAGNQRHAIALPQPKGSNISPSAEVGKLQARPLKAVSKSSFGNRHPVVQGQQSRFTRSMTSNMSAPLKIDALQPQLPNITLKVPKKRVSANITASPGQQSRFTRSMTSNISAPLKIDALQPQLPNITLEVPKKRVSANIAASPGQHEGALSAQRQKNPVQADKSRIQRKNIPKSQTRKMPAKADKCQAQSDDSSRLQAQMKVRQAHVRLKETLTPLEQSTHINVHKPHSLRSWEQNGNGSRTGEPNIRELAHEDGEESEDELSKPLGLVGTPMPRVVKRISSSFNASPGQTVSK